jgi:SAM-dependent methyltransferase
MVVTQERVDSVRAALADEWDRRAPETPEDVQAFYKECPGDLMVDDLAAFHEMPERQRWTAILMHICTTVASAREVVDIGSGAGHDLLALMRANRLIVLNGVEPNEDLRNVTAEVLARDGGADGLWALYDDVEKAPIENADVLNCVDVLEHVPNPQWFLERIAERAKIGAYLVEATATHDCGTPLHLNENRGWHPGNALEKHGWERIDQEGRLRVWKRIREHTIQKQSLIICAYRAVTLPTFQSILRLQDTQKGDPEDRWRIVCAGEAGISRARSILASRWYRETSDDVFLMVDDDITFAPWMAERIVDLCRNGHDVICAAYPVRDGGHLALRGHGQNLVFGPDLEPVEIMHGATGFFAVHRRVLDAMIPTLKLCHANQEWAFWPMFDFSVIEDEGTGGYNYLSEDYHFCEMAAKLGFKTYLDPTIHLGHLGLIELNVQNMSDISRAIGGPS